MLSVVQELNGTSKYDIRLNVAHKRKGIYSIQITDGADEYSMYSVEVNAMYHFNSFEDQSGK